MFETRRSFVLATALTLLSVPHADAGTAAPVPLPSDTTIVPGVPGERLQVRSGVLRYCPLRGAPCALVWRIARLTLSASLRSRGISAALESVAETQNNGETWSGAEPAGFGMRGEGHRLFVVLRRHGRPFAAAEAPSRSYTSDAEVRVLAGRGNTPTTVWVAVHDGDPEYMDTPSSGPLVGFAIIPGPEPRVERQQVFEHLLAETGYSKVSLTQDAPLFRYCRAHPRPRMPRYVRGGDIVVTTPGAGAFVETRLRWAPERGSFDVVGSHAGTPFPAVPRCVERLDTNVICWTF